MDYILLGEFISAVEKAQSEKTDLEDRIRRTRILAEQLNDQTLLDSDREYRTGNAGKTALLLAAEAMNVYYKLK